MNSSPPQLQYHSASLPDQSSQSVGVINSNGAPSADHSKVHSTHNILWHTLKGLRICLPVRPVIDVDVQVPSGKYRDPHHLSDLFPHSEADNSPFQTTSLHKIIQSYSRPLVIHPTTAESSIFLLEKRELERFRKTSENPYKNVSLTPTTNVIYPSK